MEKNNQILVVSNTAERTGAPILLLNILKWIKQHSDFEFIFILQSGGELLLEYENIGPVFLWNKICSPEKNGISIKSLSTKVYRKLLSRDNLFYQEKFVEKLISKYNISLVVSNTVTNGHILKLIRKRIAANVITYVHEGERLLKANNNTGLVDYSLSISNRIISVSGVVKKVLTEKYNTADKVTIIPGAIDISIVPDFAQVKFLKETLVPANAKVVMACGYAEWHKGIDLFIQVAKKVIETKQPVHFIWLGGNENDAGILQMQYDIEKLNLKDSITLISNKKNVIDYINFCDVFIVLSRDESFSLVTIEAGLLKKPVLCFDGTGGPCEIVDYDRRFIVPYASVDNMSTRISCLLENDFQRNEMGEYLHCRVINNYSIKKSARAFQDVIKETK